MMLDDMRSRGAKAELNKLPTEQRNPASRGLDTKSALEIARIINAEDAKVAPAVKRALPQIAKAIELVADAIGRGGRLIYVGTGTSGRIGALDASECPPTFNTDPETVQYLIAGGAKALAAATEASEDSRESGRRDMARLRPTRKDVVVAIASSGRTPYTIAAVEYARSRGAKAVAVTCNRGTALEKSADLGIVVEVGPEVVAGSSRMKAGTAQKMVLNMISTGAMTRLGYVYDGLMVNVHLKNSKLAARGVEIVRQITGADTGRAERVLNEAGSVPVAVVMIQSGSSRAEAEKKLEQAGGNLRRALEE